MTIHVSLVSKKIVNLFEGTSEDAQKDGAELLEPTTDTVTYSDGATEEVYGFDIPVPELDKEFDVALLGKKGVWYDHKWMSERTVFLKWKMVLSFYFYKVFFPEIRNVPENVMSLYMNQDKSILLYVK